MLLSRYCIICLFYYCCHLLLVFCSVQANTDTLKKQIEDWCELVLSYFKFHGQFKLDVTDAQALPLFHNRQIERIFSFPKVKLHRVFPISWCTNVTHVAISSAIRKC